MILVNSSLMRCSLISHENTSGNVEKVKSYFCELEPMNARQGIGLKVSGPPMLCAREPAPKTRDTALSHADGGKLSQDVLWLH